MYIKKLINFIKYKKSILVVFLVESFFKIMFCQNKNVFF
jgi:hypothetical protein